MASSFALACDALVRERDRVFLTRISTEYNLPIAELEAKYLEAAESAIKVPKVKKARVAKVTVEGGKPEASKCQALTAKKGQCSFASLKGECFCKRHLKAQAEPKQEVPKAVKPPPKKAQIKIEPVHTHGVDEGVHADCVLCQSHGNPLESMPEEEFEEVAEEPEPPVMVPVEAESESDSAAEPAPPADSASDSESDEVPPMHAQSDGEAESDFDEE